MNLGHQTGSSFPCSQQSTAPAESLDAPEQHHLHPAPCYSLHVPGEPLSAPGLGGSAGVQATSGTLQSPSHLRDAQVRMFSSPGIAIPGAPSLPAPHQHPLGVTLQPWVQEQHLQDLTCASSERKIPSRGRRCRVRAAPAPHGERIEGQEGTREILLLLGRTQGWVQGVSKCMVMQGIQGCREDSRQYRRGAQMISGGCRGTQRGLQGIPERCERAERI